MQSQKPIIYILFLSLIALSWTKYKTPFFPYLFTSSLITLIWYGVKFRISELIPGTIIIVILLSAKSLITPIKAPQKVKWIKEYSEEFKVALLEGNRKIKVKLGEKVEVGDVIDREGRVLLKGNSLSTERIRFKLYKKLEEEIDYPISAVAGACTLGLRFEIPTSIKGYFSLSGLYHFLAISGLHIGIAVGAFAGLLRLIRVRRPMTISCILFLPILPLTGLPPSALRAYLFILLLSIGLEERREVSLLYLLGVILLTSVILFDFNLSSALSFGAVGGILLSVSGEGSKLEKAIKAALGPMLFTLPITLYTFGTVNLMSWLNTILVGFIFSPFLISVFLSEITLFKIKILNILVQLSGGMLIELTKILFNLTKWAIIHSEIPLFLAGITFIFCLILLLSNKLRFILIPPSILLIYSIFNPTSITKKKFNIEGWKLNSSYFISSEGQKYKGCEIHSNYVFPSTQKLLFKSRLIDERLTKFLSKIPKSNLKLRRR